MQHRTPGHDIVDIGGMDDDRNEAPTRIDHNMALSSLHFLAAVNTALLAVIDRLDALGIDDPVADVAVLSAFFRCNSFNSSDAVSHTPR